MRNSRIPLVSLGSAVVIALALSVPAHARGEPQRSSETPPGLTKVFAKMASGVTRAIVATDDSNSRLQDVPVSP